MSKAIPESISISSKVSIQIDNKYFTVSYGETRRLPESGIEYDIEEEREELWNLCNAEVDNQIAEIIDTVKK